MLGTVAPTPYDLRFSLFGIPVRVHPFFWLFSAIMGWRGGNFKLIVLWVTCVFVSVLIHELGHALTARFFGWPPHIVLYAFGGYASYQPTWGRSTGRTLLILFAGPGAGFVFFALICAFELLIDQRGTELTPAADTVLFNLKYINLAWGLLNLLPIYPLDGGQISYTTLGHVFPRSGADVALKFSMLLAGGIAALAFWAHQMYLGFLFGSLAFENFQMLQGPRYR